jgi:exodeoxyribonuclease VII small subunit
MTNQIEKSLENIPYEQALAELEQSVSDLESSERPLEEALALYGRGQMLARYCSKLLDQAELRIEQIAGDQILPVDGETIS